MKKFLFSLITIFTIGVFQAQELRITKGAITDSLPITGIKDATYSVYVPSNYSNETSYPTIFVFDPKGRGRNTANLFRTAAEEQRYLIFSLNMDLKSKPIDSIVKTATSMVNTVISNYPVDQRLIYSAGMAEGAQVASALPFIYKNMAGIMAIGNSFVSPKHLNKDQPYMFIGLAGKKDYMIYEMEDYLRFYDNLDFPTDIYYFDGKEDEWPEASVISNAMTGFTLEAIRKGLRPADENFIRKLYEEEIASVETLRRTRNYYQAYEQLDRMKDKYEDFGFEDETEDLMKEIKRTDGFKTQRRKFKQATFFERAQQVEFDYLLREDIMTTNFKNVGWWAYQVDELEKLKNSDDPSKVNVAYRLHGYLDFVTEREFKTIMNGNFSIDTKIFISVLRTAIKRNDPEAYLKIISLAGSDGDYETALLYLEDLLKTGYSDIDALYNIEGILDLKFSKEYNEIIHKYLGEARYYDENLEDKD